MKRRIFALSIIATVLLGLVYFPYGHAVVNATQVNPVLALPMDTVASDIYSQGIFGSNSLVRMVDATPFHNDAKPCSNTNLSTYVSGANGGAQLFTAGQCWNIASNSNLHADSLGNYLTIAFWVRFDSIPSAGNFADLVIKPGEYAIFLSGTSGKITFAVPQGVGELDVVSTTLPTINTFYHVAGVWNSTHGILYINGHNDTAWTTLNSVPTENSNAIRLGDASAPGFAGILDEFYIFKRPLPQEEIGSLMSRPITTRPISSYLPDTTVGATGFNQGNPELPSATATTNADADRNSTIYIPGPIAIHQIINYTVSGTGMSQNCNRTPWSIAPNGPTNFGCNFARFQWDFFNHGTFQSAYQIIFGINNVTQNCNNNLANNCQLYIWLAEFNCCTSNSVSLVVTNSTNVASGINSWWLGVDMWITQDNQHIGLRVTNFSGSQVMAWSAATQPTVGVNRQFIEQIYPLLDSSTSNGVTRTVDFFDPYVIQHTEIWSQHVASNPPKTQIIDHRAGYIIDALCVAPLPGQGTVLAPMLTNQQGLAFDVDPGIIQWNSIQCGSQSGTSGGIGPPPPPLGTSSGGGSNCSFFGGICDLFGGVTNALLSGMGAIFAPLENTLNGLSTSLSGAIVGALFNAWQLFSAGLDNLISVLTGGKVSGGFTAFWKDITTIISTVTTNASTIINGSVTGFGDAVSIISTSITFFAGSGTNVLGTLATVLSTVLGNSALGQFVAGTGNLLLSLFGKGSGPNGTQFSYAGITYDWGPGGQILGNAGFQSFIILMIGLYLLMKLLRDPIGFGHQIGSLMYYWGHVLITILAWFFDFTMKIISWFKSLVPTWGSSW